MQDKSNVTLHPMVAIEPTKIFKSIAALERRKNFAR